MKPQSLKVIHLSFSDTSGGAARAAYRIHQSLLGIGIESRMWVSEYQSGDWTVQGVSKKEAVISKIRPQLIKPIKGLLKTDNPILHSPAILPSHWVKSINNSDADVIHLHWIQHEMLSVEDIGRIKKPIVWTLHDMWAFCGAEHYTEDMRWKDGYHKMNRPNYESGFDINRWTWKRKKKYWDKSMQIVAPSNWLADCSRKSLLFRDLEIRQILYPIDTTKWIPIEKSIARRILDVSVRKKIILFGAQGGTSDHRKGFELLMKGLNELKTSKSEIELMVFGQSSPKKGDDFPFPVKYMGILKDDISLRLMYSAADVFALPSKRDNLPLTCMEAMSCGTPVVAFDYSGPPTMIDHQSTGYLAKPFDAEDLANGIDWVLSQRNEGELRRITREMAELLFDPDDVARQYSELYDSLIT